MEGHILTCGRILDEAGILGGRAGNVFGGVRVGVARQQRQANVRLFQTNSGMHASSRVTFVPAE